MRESGRAVVTITPTYTGCPAMDVMAADIKKELLEAGVPEVEVKMSLSAWTTDWITEAGKRKLKDTASRPEKTADIRALKGEDPVVGMPRCGSKHRDALLRQYGLQGPVEVQRLPGALRSVQVLVRIGRSIDRMIG